MALIENSKGRTEGGGYERLFGHQQLGHLLSRIQATVISTGNELEKLIVGLANNIHDVDTFLNSQNLPHGTYLISKKAIKASRLSSDQEPDILIFKIDANAHHCFADYNASKVISLLGQTVNSAEKSTMYCSLHSLSGLKPIPSLCVGG